MLEDNVDHLRQGGVVEDFFTTDWAENHREMKKCRARGQRLGRRVTFDWGNSIGRWNWSLFRSLLGMSLDHVGQITERNDICQFTLNSNTESLFEVRRHFDELE